MSRTGRASAPPRATDSPDAEPASQPSARDAAPAPAAAARALGGVGPAGAAAAAIEVSPAALDLTREAAVAAAQHPDPAPAVPPTDTPDTEGLSETPPADLAESSDLGDLPGAGPGLIWLLRRAGVRSLRDLAAQEADALRPRLGLAGQLIDLDAWIGFAAEARSGPAGAAAGPGTGTAAE